MKRNYLHWLAVGALLVLVPAAGKSQISTAVKLGKYGCTSSQYHGGFYNYTPRGFFTLKKDGSYYYDGFQKPSSGKYTTDAKGNLHFKGGYFNGGQAEKIDRTNKFFLMFPTIPDHRWTCGYAEYQ